jgi:hypothetical protein
MLECLALEIGIVVYTGITHQLIDYQTYIMSSINLSSNDMSLITSEIVAAIISEVGDNLRLITPAQACGILDVSPKTLVLTGIPRIVLAPKVIKYRLCDIAAYVASCRVLSRKVISLSKSKDRFIRVRHYRLP